mgnify:CR=1 FL=1
MDDRVDGMVTSEEYAALVEEQIAKVSSMDELIPEPEPEPEPEAEPTENNADEDDDADDNASQSSRQTNNTTGTAHTKQSAQNDGDMAVTEVTSDNDDAEADADADANATEEKNDAQSESEVPAEPEKLPEYPLGATVEYELTDVEFADACAENVVAYEGQYGNAEEREAKKADAEVRTLQ